MYSVQCTVYSVQCTVYSVQCTVYSVQCTVYSVQCTVYSVQCTVYSVQCTVYSVQCTVYSVQCTVYSIQYKTIKQCISVIQTLEKCNKALFSPREQPFSFTRVSFECKENKSEEKRLFSREKIAITRG